MAILSNTYPAGGSTSPGVLDFVGAFQLDGTNDPSVLRGHRFTVSRTGVGAFTVTLLNASYKEPAYCASVQAEIGAAGAERATLGSTTTTGFTCEYQSADGTPADDTGPWIHFRLALKSTGQNR